MTPASVLTMVCLTYFVQVSLAQEVLQTVTGSIGAENYTYYRMNRQGHLLIELTSLQGDADLFVSSDNKEPTFTDYDMQSITCGADSVEIPDSFSRPINIGIYGHISAEVTDYRITVYQLDPQHELCYDELTKLYYDYEAADHMFYNYDASDYMFRDVKPGLHASARKEPASARQEASLDEEEEGSIIWQVFITLLKLFFEIVL